MKNPFERVFALLGLAFSPAAPNAPVRASLPPGPIAAPTAEIRRAEAAVPNAERAHKEAEDMHAAALRAHEITARNLETVEDTAASTPNDDNAAALLEAQQYQARTSGILRAAVRRVENAASALAAARARLEGARADAERAEAEARIVKASDDIQKASTTYTTTHPAPKLAALFDMSKKAFGEACTRAPILRADIVASIEDAEAADEKALAAEPHRADEIKAEADKRRAAARNGLETLADIDRWNEHAAPAIALLALSGELERAANKMLADLTMNAHEAALAAQKLGSEYEPIHPKLAIAATILGKYLGADPATRDDRQGNNRPFYVIMNNVITENIGWGLSFPTWYQQMHALPLRPEEIGRLMLRDPSGRCRTLAPVIHKKLLERGDRTALEYEESQGRGTDPRLEAMRAEDQERAAAQREAMQRIQRGR